MAKNQNLARGNTLLSVRPGEGVLVDLRPALVRDVAGTNSAKMTANINNVPVPNKRYSADVCFVGFNNDTFKLLFAQEKFNSTELRTLLIVKMSEESVGRFLETLEDTDPPFSDYAETAGFRIEELGAFTQEPSETVAFDANFVLVGMSGKEGCADFYHSSAFAMGASKASGKLALDPVVRVDIRSSLLLGMLKVLRETYSEVAATGGNKDE